MTELYVFTISRRDNEGLSIPASAYDSIRDTARYACVDTPMLDKLALKDSERVRANVMDRFIRELHAAGEAVLSHHPLERRTVGGEDELLLSSAYTSPHLATILYFTIELAEQARGYPRRLDVLRTSDAPSHPLSLDGKLKYGLEHHTYPVGTTDLADFRKVRPHSTDHSHERS